MPLYLDSPVDGAHIAGNALHVQGWASDRAGDEGSPVRDVTILLDGVPLGRAGLTWPRPDVAEAHGDPRRGLCGFDRVVTLPPALREPGPHTVAVEARLLDGRSRRTTPVRVDFPPLPSLPAEGVAPLRPRQGGGPIRSVWLARSLDQGGSQLRMAETRRAPRAPRLDHDRAVRRPRARCAPASRRPARGCRLVEAVPFDDVDALPGGRLAGSSASWTAPISRWRRQ